MSWIIKNSAVRRPLRTIYEISGYPTETLLWPASVNKNKTILMFIPGNPGLVEYYTSFLEGIYSSVASPSLEIIAVSHKGHVVNYNKDEKRVYSLRDQIQHKIDCLDLLTKENEPDTHFVLMGHSIGAYISVDVLKERPNHGISRIIALFPTLREIAATPNGVQIQRIVKRLPFWLTRLGGSLLFYLPPPLRQYLVELFTGQSDEGLQVTSHQLLHPTVLQNVLNMAKDEMEAVRGLDHDFYLEHLDKFIMYYSENDQWAPKDHHEYMTKHFPEGKIHLCTEKIPHAFCLESKHVDYMAQKVASWIEEDTKKD
ncbi:hypothetical protein BD560DRAFT_389287 [Blakeslea trispora]|nr:hypothetical protein BD560DRAFT_389287 [Blakeslea trispora]